MDGTILEKKYDIIARLEALEAGGGGGGYVLPTATAERLGGVKIGDNLTVEEDGTLNAPAPYTPPAYSTSEVNTGRKWIDGRDVFQKVYNDIQMGNSTDVTVDANFGADKTVIHMFGVANTIEQSARFQTPISSYSVSNDTAYPRVFGDALILSVAGNWSTNVATIVVEYVKDVT